MDGIVVFEVVKNPKSDFIRIHIGKSYLNLAIEDIFGIKTSKPFGASLTVELTTPFGEFALEGKQAEKVSKKIALKEPSVGMCL